MQAGAGFLIFLSKENSYEDQDPSGYRFYYNYCGSDFSDLRRDHGSEQLSDPLLSENLRAQRAGRSPLGKFHAGV